MNIYFTNIRRLRFSILYLKYLQTLILCVTTFYKMAFYYKVFRRRLKSCNIKMVKVSYILHYKCVVFPKFNKLSKCFPVVRRLRFSILYLKYLQTLILCVTTFYKMAFYYKVFRRRLKSCNIKMVKVSYILHYKCVVFPKFNKLSKCFPVVWFVTIL